MIILSTTSDQIQVVLDSSVTTTQLQCYACYRDTTTTSITPGRKAIATNNTTAAELVGSPASSTQRVVEYIRVYNKDTANATVTLSLYISTTLYTLLKTTLQPGDRLEYQQGSGFRVLASDGAIREVPNQTGANITSNLQYAYVSTDQTISSTSYVDITDLNFAVKANRRYYFNFIMPYSSPQTFQGVKFSINGPSSSYVAYYSIYPSSTTAVTYNNGIPAYDLPSTVFGNTTLAGIAKLEGIVHITADGTLTGRCGGEVANTIVVKKGAVVFYSELN